MTSTLLQLLASLFEELLLHERRSNLIPRGLEENLAYAHLYIFNSVLIEQSITESCEASHAIGLDKYVGAQCQRLERCKKVSELIVLSNPLS